MEQQNCERLRIWLSELHRIQDVYIISLVYIILVNSTKTLTHNVDFLAHISTNLVSNLIRFT